MQLPFILAGSRRWMVFLASSRGVVAVLGEVEPDVPHAAGLGDDGAEHPVVGVADVAVLAAEHRVARVPGGERPARAVVGVGPVQRHHVARAAERALLGRLEALHVAREGGADGEHAEPEQEPELRRAHERRADDEVGDEDDRRERRAGELEDRQGRCRRRSPERPRDARLGLARRPRPRCRARRRPVIASGDDSLRARSSSRARWALASRAERGPAAPPRRRSRRDAGERPRRRGSSCSRGRTRCGRGSTPKALVWAGGAARRRSPATCWCWPSACASRTGTPRRAPGASCSPRARCTRCRSTGRTSSRALRGARRWRPSAACRWSRASGARSYDWLAGGRVAQTVASAATAGRLLRAAARGRRDLERRGRRRPRRGSRPLARRRGVRRLRRHEPRPRGGARVGRGALGRLAARALRVAALARPAAAGDVALLGARRHAVADRRGDRSMARRAAPRPARERRRSGRRGRSRRQRLAARDAPARRPGRRQPRARGAPRGRPRRAVDGRARHRRAAARARAFATRPRSRSSCPTTPTGGASRGRGACRRCRGGRATAGRWPARWRRRRRRCSATRPTPSCASRAPSDGPSPNRVRRRPGARASR